MSLPISAQASPNRSKSVQIIYLSSNKKMDIKKCSIHPNLASNPWARDLFYTASCCSHEQATREGNRTQHPPPPNKRGAHGPKLTPVVDHLCHMSHSRRTRSLTSQKCLNLNSQTNVVCCLSRAPHSFETLTPTRSLSLSYSSLHFFPPLSPSL